MFIKELKCKNNIEESVQVEMVRDDLRVLLKVFFEAEMKISKSEYETFRELIGRVAKQYGGKDIYEAHKYFFDEI